MSMYNLILNGYERHAFTNNYIFTITVKNTKVACFLTDCKILPFITYFDKSRQSIRFRPSEKQKQLIIGVAEKIVPICSKDFFLLEKQKQIPNKKGKLTTYNAGETAERLVTTEIFKQIWEKDNIEWWIDGDITDGNGKAWQIKDESNATFCHLNQFIENGWAL